MQEQLRFKGITVLRNCAEQRIDFFVEPHRSFVAFYGIHGKDQTKRIVIIPAAGLITFIAVRIPDEEKFRMVPGEGGIQLLYFNGTG